MQPSFPFFPLQSTEGQMFHWGGGAQFDLRPGLIDEAEQSTPEKKEGRICSYQYLRKPPSILHLAWVEGEGWWGRGDWQAHWVFDHPSIGTETQGWGRRASHSARSAAMSVFPHSFFHSFSFILCFVVCQRHGLISTSWISGALFILTPYKFTVYCFVHLPPFLFS